MRTAALELRLLGGFELLADGSALTLSSKKGRALLGLLALGRGRAQSRDKLAALLWAGAAEEQARTSLRQTLASLRKCLGQASDALVSLPAEDVQLAIDASAVDALEFERLVSQGDVPDLRRALELYRGPLLDGLSIREDPFDDWLRDERRRYFDLALAGMDRLRSLEQHAGQMEAALAVAQGLLRLDPLREESHRALMDIHCEMGNVSAALRQYRDLESTLRDELAVEPAPETRRLYELLLQRRDQHTDGAPNEPLPPPSMTPLVPPRHADGRPTLVVLPFDDLNTDSEQNYFSDGITEDIITELSRFPDLFVIARNSSFAFKGRNATVQQVRTELGADYVVQGSVRRAGDRVRVSAELSDAESARHIWGERYDRAIADVLELQDELTRGIVAVLPGRVESFERKRIARKPPTTMVAYELLLAGKIHHHRITQADNARALQLLDQALSLDPDYAAAWAWKGCVLGQALGRAYRPDKDALLSEAARAVERGLELDPNEVECHRILAEICLLQQQFDQAWQHNRRAVLLNANDPRLVAQTGQLSTVSGDAERGVECIQLAMQLDPYNAGDWAHLLGRALLAKHAYAEAIRAYRGASYPRVSNHADMAGCYRALGDLESSRRQIEQLLKLSPDFSVDGYIQQLAYQHAPYRKHHVELVKSAF